jgi:hypothetical protein
VEDGEEEEERPIVRFEFWEMLLLVARRKFCDTSKEINLA